MTVPVPMSVEPYPDNGVHRRIPEYAVAPGETIGYTAYRVRLADPLPIVWT